MINTKVPKNAILVIYIYICKLCTDKSNKILLVILKIEYITHNSINVDVTFRDKDNVFLLLKCYFRSNNIHRVN